MYKIRMHHSSNRKYHMIFSDIDGTLLNNAHKVTQDTKEKILELEEEGIPFVLVSARMPQAIKTVSEQIGNQAPIISFNGGLLIGDRGEKLYESRLEFKVALEIKCKMDRNFPGICCNTYVYSKWVVDDDKNPWIIKEEKITELKSEVGKIEEIFKEEAGIHKFLFMGDSEDIKKAEAFLKRDYPKLAITISLPNYLEITDGNVNKSAGIKFLCNYYGITTEEVIAFGDGYNDIDMLRSVKRSYAMENAPLEVKNSAAYIAPSNEQEGVLRVLKELFP